MDILNNRELALAVWIIAALIFCLVKPSLRGSIGSVLKALFAKQIVLHFCLMSSYIGLVVFGLSKAGLWEQSQTKITVIWVFSVASVWLYRIDMISRDPYYFSDIIKDTFAIIIVVEFIVAFYAFNLFIELLLVPIFFVLGGMLALAQKEEKYKQVEKLISYLLSIIVVAMIIHSVFRIAVDTDKLFTVQIFQSFYLPPILSILFFPYVFFMAMFANYERVFLVLPVSIKNDDVRAYAKKAALVAFRLDTELLRRWSHSLFGRQIKDTGDVDESIREIQDARIREENSEIVPIERGWSPYAARDFLSEENLVADYYRKTSGELDEWFSCSPYLDLSESILPNRIAYYVDGNMNEATTLKIVLDVSDPECFLQAHKKLGDCSRILFRNALDEELPTKIFRAVVSGSEFANRISGKEVSLIKEDWISGNGYTLKFVLSNPS